MLHLLSIRVKCRTVFHVVMNQYTIILGCVMSLYEDQILPGDTQNAGTAHVRLYTKTKHHADDS